MIRHVVLALVLLGLVPSCGLADGDDGGGPPAATEAEGEPPRRTTTEDPTLPLDDAVEADAAPPAGETPGSAADVTAEELLALVEGCADELTTSRYATDVGESANLRVCGLPGAVFWKADMDIDCDGKKSAACSKKTDASYLPETAATDSKGKPLDASKLPFVVVPLPSSRFDYKAAGLRLGNAVVVLYDGKLAYGVIGDLGPKSILGEASYAMAESLGIDPDPSTGGVDSGVVYIAFTGTSANVAPIEDHAEAVKVGSALAKKLVADQP